MSETITQQEKQDEQDTELADTTANTKSRNLVEDKPLDEMTPKEQFIYKLNLLKVELGLEQDKSVLANTTEGIPMSYGIGFIPRTNTIILPTDELLEANKYICNSISCDRLDTHPLAILYTVKIQSKKPRLEKYLKKVTDAEQAKNLIDMVEVQTINNDKHLVFDIQGIQFTVTT
jgi:hypothetical protein